MWDAFIVVTVSSVIAIVQGRSLLKNGKRKELTVFGTLLLLSVVIALMEAFDVGLANPYVGIDYLFGWMAEWMERVALI